MLDNLPHWMGDLSRTYPANLVGLVSAVASIVCGAAIGLEREQREKPAGIRTMVLVCLGSTIFTQAGTLMAGSTGDPSRIAAQVVTGVGFLGAGAIIRERGMLIGVTTGAAIWAVAAIGVVVGSGHVFAGLVFTALAIVTLVAQGGLARLFAGTCEFVIAEIEFDVESGRTRPRIQEILDRFQMPDAFTRFEPGGTNTGRVHVRYCRSHRHHREFLAALAELPAVRAIREST